MLVVGGHPLLAVGGHPLLAAGGHHLLAAGGHPLLAVGGHPLLAVGCQLGLRRRPLRGFDHWLLRLGSRRLALECRNLGLGRVGSLWLGLGCGYSRLDPACCSLVVRAARLPCDLLPVERLALPSSDILGKRGRLLLR
jgi:hypothetical protein